MFLSWEMLFVAGSMLKTCNTEAITRRRVSFARCLPGQILRTRIGGTTPDIVKFRDWPTPKAPNALGIWLRRAKGLRNETFRIELVRVLVNALVMGDTPVKAVRLQARILPDAYLVLCGCT